MRTTLIEDPAPVPGDPKDEPLRKDVKPPTYGEFLQRTRRYHKLTKRTTQLHYARGLDTKPEDLA